MEKLSRINLGGVENLVKKTDDLKYLGEGVFKGSRRKVEDLIIKTKQETKQLNMGYSKIRSMTRDAFLDTINLYLEANDLYLANVELGIATMKDGIQYQYNIPNKLGTVLDNALFWITPNMIKGDLYIMKEQKQTKKPRKRKQMAKGGKEK